MKSKSFSNRFNSISYFIITKLPIYVLWLVGLYFVVRFLNDLSQDTTGVTNSAFAILASFSALCFTASRSIENEKEVKNSYEYAGERFFHAAILFITASVIKYGILSVKPLLISYLGLITSTIIVSVMNISVPLLFSYALNFSHIGLSVINKLLWLRVALR